MTFEPLHCFIPSESPDQFGSLGRALKDWLLSVVFKIDETARCVVYLINTFWIDSIAFVFNKNPNPNTRNTTDKNAEACSG